MLLNQVKAHFSTIFETFDTNEDFEKMIPTYSKLENHKDYSKFITGLQNDIGKISATFDKGGGFKENTILSSSFKLGDSKSKT